MSISEIKIRLHQRIDHFFEAQCKTLYNMLIKSFPEESSDKTRQLSTLPRLVKCMAPDFNEPLEDFKAYMPE